ncbi:MAG TPA: DUF106 domain-containing protein [Thermoplasmatales archaeon]|nr:DUF106 domain-containing protein [Thermoplasmatales archaeon]
MKVEQQQQPLAGSYFLPFLVMFLMLFIIGDVRIRAWIALSLDKLFYPLIGFGGSYPLLTLVIAGIIVVTLSSFFTNLFMDWKAMGRAQEISKHFQEELKKARKENNAAKIKKLMEMQPKILQMHTQSSSGMTKQMIFAMIFIAPIFIWLMYFLSKVPYLYFTTPWANTVSFVERSPIFITNWFLFYLIFSIVVGQVVRQCMKYLKLSGWWQNIKGVRKSAD